MDGFDFSNPASSSIFELETRNRLANRTIEEYTTIHRRQDGLLALGGFIPVPGAGFAAMLAAMALQAPRVYKPMAQKMGSIYFATREELQEIDANVICRDDNHACNTEHCRRSGYSYEWKRNFWHRDRVGVYCCKRCPFIDLPWRPFYPT